MSIDQLAAKRRLEFLEVEESDRAALRALWPLFEKEIGGLLDGFYDTIMKWETLKQLIDAHSDVPKLKQAQAGHWKRLFSGEFNQDYFDRAFAIGKAHERVGLKPQWYVGGYTYLLSRLQEMAVTKLHKKPKELSAALAAVNKAVMLEIAISVYIDASDLTLKRELNDLADELEATVHTAVEAEILHPVPEHAHAIRTERVTFAETVGRQRLADVDTDRFTRPHKASGIGTGLFKV